MKVKKMIRYPANPTLTIIVLMALVLLATACSPSAAKLTDAGNQAFARQAYGEAVQAYAEAQAKSPELAEPPYNLANVLYRQGQYKEALKALQQAAQIAQAGQVAQNSHFNSGNAAFNTQSWEAAIESYRQALLRNPADQDAKHNLELALQQMQQHEQQQNQDQQNQDQQDQGQQNQDQQDQGQQNQDQQDQDQQNQDQQDQGQQNQDQQQDSQDQQDQQQGQQDQSQDGQGQQGQGQDEQQQRGQDGQPPKDQQGQPPREQQAQGQSKDGQPQERPGSQLAPGQRMTQDQARQLLAAIAGKTDTLQGRLGQFLRVRGRPPVQDW